MSDNGLVQIEVEEDKADKLINVLERLANGIEGFMNEPMIEVEPTPPKCPNCHTINPEVVIPSSDESVGPINELIVVAVCAKCEKELFAMSSGWIISGDKQSAIETGNAILGRNENG